ncbi:MAG: RNA polymerase sigma factor [Pirellulales bacterium]|nr:RNA polymerase sigma factor [Pirellulales bacterium]
MSSSQMLTAAARRDRVAFSELVEQHQNIVYGYLRSRVLDASDADDLCQEVFMRCYASRMKFDSAEMVRPWLIGIARNVLREHVRRVKRRKEVAWTTLCLELDSLIGNESEQEGPYDEYINHLPTCMDNLGPSAQNALNLHYAEGLKIAEIGERLHRSIGAVKLLMFRARQTLRRCLAGKTLDERDGPTAD